MKEVKNIATSIASGLLTGFLFLSMRHETFMETEYKIETILAVVVTTFAVYCVINIIDDAFKI